MAASKRPSLALALLAILPLPFPLVPLPWKVIRFFYGRRRRCPNGRKEKRRAYPPLFPPLQENRFDQFDKNTKVVFPRPFLFCK